MNKSGLVFYEGQVGKGLFESRLVEMVKKECNSHAWRSIDGLAKKINESFARANKNKVYGHTPHDFLQVVSDYYYLKVLHADSEEKFDRTVCTVVVSGWKGEMP